MKSKLVILFLLVFCLNFTKEQDLPINFDWRFQINYEKCFINPLKNSEDCQNTTSFSSEYMLSKRICIESIRQGVELQNVNLSQKYIIDCVNNENENKCENSEIQKVLNFLVTNGTLSEECKPYNLEFFSCDEKCESNIESKFYKGKEIRIQTNKNEIKEEIMNKGPVITEFHYKFNFLGHNGKYVYKNERGDKMGIILVSLIGWGVDDEGTSYWIVANNWGGNSTIDKGYFKASMNLNIGKVTYSIDPILNVKEFNNNFS